MNHTIVVVKTRTIATVSVVIIAVSVVAVLRAMSTIIVVRMLRNYRITHFIFRARRMKRGFIVTITAVR